MTGTSNKSSSPFQFPLNYPCTSKTNPFFGINMIMHIFFHWQSCISCPRLFQYCMMRRIVYLVTFCFLQKPCCTLCERCCVQVDARSLPPCHHSSHLGPLCEECFSAARWLASLCLLMALRGVVTRPLALPPVHPNAPDVCSSLLLVK